MLKYKIPQIVTLTRKRIPLMNSIIFVRLLSDCFKSKEDKRL